MRKLRTKSKGSQSIQRYMLKTYLVITGISVFVEILFCIYMLATSSSQLRTTQRVEIDRVTQWMDDILDDVTDQSDQLSDDSTVKKVLNYSAYPQYHGADVLDIKTIMNSFSNTLYYYPQIESLYLMNFERNTMISESEILHENDFYAFLDQNGITKNALADRIKSEKNFLFSVENEASEKHLFYVTGIYRKNYIRPDGYLFVKLNLPYLDQVLQSYNSQNSSFCYLLSNETGYLGSDENTADFVSKIMGTAKSVGTVTFDSTRYAYTIAPSGVIDISYCYITRTFDYYKSVYFTMILTLVSLIVMISVSLYLSRTFTKKNTAPLLEMAKTMEEDVTSESLSYDRILSDVTGIVGKMRSYEEQIKYDTMALIFHGQEKNEQKINDFQALHKDAFSEKFHILGIKLVGLKEDSDLELLLFCIINVFSELLVKHMILTPVEGWDRVYFLIRSDHEDSFLEALKEGIEFFEERFEFSVVCGISEPIASLTQIQEARLQTDYMIEYVELNKGAKYAYYSALATGSDENDNNFSSNLKKLMHFVIAQEYSGCKKLVEKMCAQSIDSAQGNLTNTQQKLITITSIISIPYKERYGSDEFQIPRESNPEIYQFILHMLSKLESGEDDEASQNTFKKMKTYIEQHATDPELTAGGVSDAFNLSASYASGMYKKFAGEGILDAIHKERIRQSKILLKSGVSVQDTAIKTGYLDARGFIRTFKKYEGITPGQFKNL